MYLKAESIQIARKRVVNDRQAQAVVANAYALLSEILCRVVPIHIDDSKRFVQGISHRGKPIESYRHVVLFL